MNKDNRHELSIWDIFDPEDDVILPDTILGELYYIYCILSAIITNNCNRKLEWFRLKRQIRIYFRWRKNS